MMHTTLYIYISIPLKNGAYQIVVQRLVDLVHFDLCQRDVGAVDVGQALSLAVFLIKTSCTGLALDDAFVSLKEEKKSNSFLV